MYTETTGPIIVCERLVTSRGTPALFEQRGGEVALKSGGSAKKAQYWGGVDSARFSSRTESSPPYCSNNTGAKWFPDQMGQPRRPEMT